MPLPYRLVSPSLLAPVDERAYQHAVVVDYVLPVVFLQTQGVNGILAAYLYSRFQYVVKKESISEGRHLNFHSIHIETYLPLAFEEIRVETLYEQPTRIVGYVVVHGFKLTLATENAVMIVFDLPPKRNEENSRCTSYWNLC